MYIGGILRTTCTSIIHGELFHDLVFIYLLHIFYVHFLFSYVLVYRDMHL